MEDIRYHVRQTLYCLLVNYLMGGTRDVSNRFYYDKKEVDRKVIVDNVSFQITQKVPTQNIELPEVALAFNDEIPDPASTNPKQLHLLISTHVTLPLSENILADDRTLLKMQRLVDEVYFGSSVVLVDLTGPIGSDPVQLNRRVHWFTTRDRNFWANFSNLGTQGLLHKSKNMEVLCEDDPIAYF